MNLFYLFYLSVLFVWTTCVNGIEDFRTVNLSQGPVRGYKEPGAELYVFYGIPYATAPTGKFKYKAPLPPPSWTELYEATNKLVSCPPFFSVQENCLIANVYIPDTNVTKLPVLVIVHGGGFVTGFGEMLRPLSLVNTQKIIAVTFNYRLGVNGFLCLGTEDIPGNAGMKDQVALLRWVRNNIERFGGNPDDVTLLGYSVGSASVNLITLSQSARGLFNKVIPQSGSELSPFAIQQDPLSNAKNFARTFSNISINVNDIRALEKFYKETPLVDLMAHMIYLNDDFTINFSPCVESNKNADSFLVDSPMNILKSGNYTKVPMLYGFTNMEGLMRIQEFDIFTTGMNQNFSNYLPGSLKFESKEEKEKVANLVKRFYFGDKLVGTETVLNFVEYLTDAGFTVDTLKSIKTRLETGSSDIYLYEYTFVDTNTPLIPYTNTRGPGHIAQTELLLDQNSQLIKNTETLTPSFLEMKNIMSEIFINFILTGKPVPNVSASLPTWPPVQTFNSPYMTLNMPLTLNVSALEGRFDFWQKIYDTHYRMPKAPMFTSASSSLHNLSMFTVILFMIVGKFFNAI